MGINIAKKAQRKRSVQGFVQERNHANDKTRTFMIVRMKCPSEGPREIIKPI